MRWVVALFTLFSFSLQAQVITILDAESSTPIERVLVFSKNREQSLLSGVDGKVDLRAFKAGDTLVLQHPAFVLRQLEPGSSELFSGKVYLVRKIIQLSEFVVSASHWEQDRKEVPFRIMQLDARQINLAQSPTMADVLGSSGEIFIQKSQAGGGSPMIRGFSANSLLIVVDGIRMNNAIFRSGNLQNVVLLDAMSLASAEVIMGPGAAIYGSDALGGVMDFHTRKPMLQPDSTARTNGAASFRYASASGERSGHILINQGFEKWAWLGSVTLSSFGDLRSGRSYPAAYPEFGKREWYVDQINDQDTVLPNPDPSVQIPSGYQQLNILQKIRYVPRTELDLTYAFHLSTGTDVHRYDRLTEGSSTKPRYASWYYGPQKWMINQVTIVSRKPVLLWDKFMLNAAHQDITESRHDRRYQNSQLFHRTDELTALNLNLDAEKEISARFRAYYGTEVLWNDIHSRGEQENIFTGQRTSASSRYPDGQNRYYGAAFYAQGSYRPAEVWVLQSGLRYTYTGLQSFIEDNSFYNLPFNKIDIEGGALTGNVGVIHHPTKHWQLNLMLGSGFRAPNLDDAGKIFDSEPGFLIVPNQELGPEYTYNLEAGIIYRASENIRMEALAYHTWVRDIMVRSDYSYAGRDSLMYDGQMSRIQALVNSGKARIYGASLVLYARPGRAWAIQQQLHLTRGYEEPERLPLRHIPPLFGMTRISWQNKLIEVHATMEFNGWKRTQDFAPSERNKPHIYTVDGSPAWYAFHLKAQASLGKHLRLSAGVENILDRHYRPYSSGISAPGRNFILSLQGQF